MSKKEIEKHEIETQSIIDLQNEVKTFLSKETNKLGNYRQSLAKTLQEKTQSQDELKILKKELGTLNKKLAQSGDRRSKLSQETKKFLSKKEDLVKEKLAKKKELDSINDESKKIGKELKLAKEIINDSKNQIEKRNIEIQTIKEIIKDRQKTHAENNTKAIQLKKQVKSLTIKKDLAEKDLALAKNEDGASRKKLKDLENSTNTKMKVLQTNISKLSSELEKFQSSHKYNKKQMKILSKKSSQEQVAAKKKIEALKKRKDGLNRKIAGKISFEEQKLSKNCKIFSKKKGEKVKSLKLGLKGESYKVTTHNQKWLKVLVDKKLAYVLKSCFK